MSKFCFPFDFESLSFSLWGVISLVLLFVLLIRLLHAKRGASISSGRFSDHDVSLIQAARKRYTGFIKVKKRENAVERTQTTQQQQKKKQRERPRQPTRRVTHQATTHTRQMNTHGFCILPSSFLIRFTTSYVFSPLLNLFLGVFFFLLIFSFDLKLLLNKFWR